MVEKMPPLWVFLILLVASNNILVDYRCFQGFVLAAEPQVPCFFIFGDSLSDNGNNNLLHSLAKANFPPYGIDFPYGPTGRFTNGRTVIDLISEHLGLEFIPPLYRARGDDQVLKGVNYASGSAGILDETGITVGQRIPIDEQLRNHRKVISRITNSLGNDDGKVKEHLNQCLYSVYAGSNDFLLNYFPTHPALTLVGLDHPDHSLANFTKYLMARYTQQLKTLYEYGARKVVIFGLGPLGCLPTFVLLGGCSQPINNALHIFNRNLTKLVDDFNTHFSDAKFILIDTMKIVSPDLSALGLRVKHIPCCGVGKSLYCLPHSIICSDRDEYVYWDNAHPTEAANKLLARRAYKAEVSGDAYPTDISQLVSDEDDHSSSDGGDHKRSVGPESATRYGKRRVFFMVLIFGAMVI